MLDFCSNVHSNFIVTDLLTEASSEAATILAIASFILTFVLVLCNFWLARATQKLAESTKQSLEVAQEQFNKEWRVDFHVEFRKTSSSFAVVEITNLGRISARIISVHFHAMPTTNARTIEFPAPLLVEAGTSKQLSIQQYLTEHLGELGFDSSVTANKESRGFTLALSLLSYAGGTRSKSPWFRFEVLLVGTRFGGFRIDNIRGLP